MDRWLGDGGMPLIAVLGGAFVAYGEGWAEATWEPTELAANPHGYVQAGVHDVMLDASMSFAVQATLSGRDRARSTLDLKAAYYRAAFVGRSFRLRGQVIRIAKQVAFAEADCRDADENIVSSASGTFLLHREAVVEAGETPPPPMP